MTGNPPAETGSDPTAFRASVVIPAHNEQMVIARCLRSLAAQKASADIEVVVVANGCTDETAATAGAFTDLPHLTVVDVREPSKSNALNRGDAVATAFPRIYLDADVTLADGALDALIAALDVAEPRIAAPRIRFDLSASSHGVREFFRVYTRLPYVSSGLVGLGVYGMSRAGRARFDAFPSITADDLFAQRVFTPAERRIVDAEFVVTAPRDLLNLLKVRTRVARGNTELRTVTDGPQDADFAATTGGTVSALTRLVRREPVHLPAALFYMVVTLLARARARRAAPTGTWDRDDSTR